MILAPTNSRPEANPSVSRQFVALNRASGQVTYGTDRVRAAGGAHRKNAGLEKWFQVCRGWNVPGILTVLQSPLLFGRVNRAEIINAEVLHSCIARFDEIGDGDGQHQRYQKNGKRNVQVTGNQPGQGQALANQGTAGTA